MPDNSIIECILNGGVPCPDIWSSYTFVLWVAGGLFLVLMEFFIPGIFVIFFGIGAVITGIAQYSLQISLAYQLTLWILSSLTLLFFGAGFMKKLFPAEEKYVPVPRDSFKGRVVKVTKKVKIDKRGGRISYQGTEWDAISTDSEIEEGDYATIVDRNNLTYLVQKANTDEIEKFLASLKTNEEE